MANRRLFSKEVVRSDSFLGMSLTAQALYFHLGMEADDDGFVSNPITLMRMVGAREDDLNLLIAKCFIIKFTDGVVLVKHWKVNNYIRLDRYHPTVYTDDKAKVYQKETGVYTLDPAKGVPLLGENDDGNQMATIGQPNGNQMETEVKLSKDKLSKDKLSKEKTSKEKPRQSTADEKDGVEGKTAKDLQAKMDEAKKSFSERMSKNSDDGEPTDPDDLPF